MMACSMTLQAQEADTTSAGTDRAKAEEALRTKKKVETRIIRGRVVDAAGHSPKGGALVSTHGIEGYSTLTEDDGSYELAVPLFATSIDITAPDCNPVRTGLKRTETQADVILYPNTLDALYDDLPQAGNARQAYSPAYSSALSVEENIQRELGASVRTLMRNGTPGIGAIMTMNGIGSINANAQPLIVIDGVPVDQQYGREMLHAGFYNNILTSINPADIEKVTVLRAGTALYGAKGANGVILIDTKRSRSMATRITASVSAGVEFEPRFYDMMDANGYRTYASELLNTTNTTIRDFNFLDDSPSNYYREKYNKNTDWKKDIYRAAFRQDYGINVQGGDPQERYNENLRQILDAQMRYTSAHHSNAYYWNLDPDSLKQVNALLGTNLANEWTDFSKLTPEQMDEIRTMLPDVWEEMINEGKYGDRFREDWENYADQAGKVEELTEQINENLTQTSFDSLRSNFLDTLMDMDADAQDFADYFSEMMQRALLNFAMGDMLDDQLKEWYNSLAETISNNNGKLSQGDIEDFRNDWQNMADKWLNMRDTISQITGYTGESSSSTQQSASSKGYATATQDSIDELNGRFTAIYEADLKIIDIFLDAVTTMSAITSVATDCNTELKNILNQQVLTNSHLEDIAKYTKPILELGGKLDKIVANTNKL